MKLLLISLLSLVTSGAAFHSMLMKQAPLMRKTASSSLSMSVQSSVVDFDTTTGLVKPHGGKLTDLMSKDAEKDKSGVTKTIQLTSRQLCDVELIINGGLSPLEGFMDEDDYNSVVNDCKLTNGLVFGLPIVFDTDDEDLKVGDKCLLKDGDRDIAVMDVTSKYQPNKVVECMKCYGTSKIEHPGSLMVATERGKYYAGGKLTGLNLPVRDFPCETPQEVRNKLPKNTDVVAFQCRNPIHRAHYELFTRALDDDKVDKDAVVLVHPTCGPTQADDIPGTVRFKTYTVLAEETKNDRIKWAYLPYSMHMAGPREAVQHAMIRKNYGCTAFIIGRDMAGSKSSVTGDDFYGAYDAQDFLISNQEKLGVKAVPSLNLVYTEEEGYTTADYAEDKKLTKKTLSGTKFRKAMRAGEPIPEWFAFKSVVEVLRDYM